MSDRKHLVDLDMTGNRIRNLPVASNPDEPVRKGDLATVAFTGNGSDLSGGVAGVSLPMSIALSIAMS